MSSEKATLVWSTGPEQVEVELVVGGEMYNVDVDIAKRMGIIQGESLQRAEGVTFDSPFGLTGCSSRDFERALTFCAEDRSCSEPPSKELAHIIRETALPGADLPPGSPGLKPAREASTSALQKGLAELTVADDEDDEEDGSYVPSESEDSESEDEVSDTDPTDIGTASIKAERDEYNAREKEKSQQGLEK